jgi:hypothetical protein
MNQGEHDHCLVMAGYGFLAVVQSAGIYKKCLVAVLASVTTILLASCTNDPDMDHEPDMNSMMDDSFSLSDIPPNRWIKYHEVNDGLWRRKWHAGLAYDSTRGHLLVFGSDTHGEDWDNVVHEFIPAEGEWLHHGAESAIDTYSVSHDGYPVAGEAGNAPWAMHTYDGIDYDPVSDSLVVVASPLHNPIGKKHPERKSDPVWIYNLQTRDWSRFSADIRRKPGIHFGSAVSYDELDEILYICKSGLWGMDIPKEKYERIADAPNCLHSSVAFDKWRRQLYVFGSYKGTANVSRYIPVSPEEAGGWEELIPGGDLCPPYSKAPVAFDEKNGVFLLVTDDAGNRNNGNPGVSATFIYDPGANTYQKLDDAALPATGMNFMMAWDKVHEVFFIVTGNREDGVTVWTLRLAVK